MYRGDLKANCQKERNCGLVIKVNSSEKKHDSTRLTAEHFWTRYEWAQWKKEKQSGAPVTTYIHAHICASCIYIVTRLQELEKVQLSKPSASRLLTHQVTTGPSPPHCWPDEGEKRVMMGSRREKDNKWGGGKDAWETQHNGQPAQGRKKVLQISERQIIA